MTVATPDLPGVAVSTRLRDQNTSALNIGPLSGIAIDEANRHIWVCNLEGVVLELVRRAGRAGGLIPLALAQKNTVVCWRSDNMV